MVSGVDGVAVDPEVLAWALGVVAEVRAPFGPEVGSARQLREVVVAACGRSCPGVDGLDALDRLLATAAETEGMIDGVRRAAVEADTPEVATVPPIDDGTEGPWWAPILPVPDRLVSPATDAVQLLVGMEGMAAAASPWLDPDTDSWVVNLTRIAGGGRPSAAFLERVAEDGPGLWSTLTNPEHTPTGQLALALDDPAGFLANWGRALEGAGDSIVGVVSAAAAAALLLNPGIEAGVGEALGHRPGAELAAAVLATVPLITSDPDAVGEATIGWETLADDPYRWAGAQLPDVVFETLTPGIPLVGLARARRALAASPVPVRPVGPRPPVWSFPRWRSPLPIAGSQPPWAGPYPDLDATRRGEGIWGPTEGGSIRDAPFEPPERWVAEINGPGFGAPGRTYNCIDCTRAVEANWRGQGEVAAPLIDPTIRGVSGHLLEDWSGGRFRPTTVDGLGAELERLGPGASAMVVSSWDYGGGHAYNAINDGGVVRWVDGQTGQTMPWPPRYGGQVSGMLAIVIDAAGRPQ